ncbi:MAG TPA: helix-turn-helix transcriptional regulator, partial [Planosporangium sp.]|nr:helix-turn-helix transcriptional regulator [Planosporangium sp.]
METFGQAVRRMRKQRGLSLRAFARQVKFVYTYVGQIERGEKIGSNAFASHSDRVLEAGGALVRLYADADQQRRYGHVWADADEQQRTPVHESDDLGLTWSPTVTTTVETVIQMWRADMQRRSFLVRSAFVVGGFTPAIRDWLISWQDAQANHTGGRRVGSADVAVLWDSCHSFQEIDRRLGGAVARTSLVHFLDHVITPLLEGSYDDATGRDLLAVAGRLTDIAAYSAYDAHEQGMAQRYYIQALRMARAANSESLGAHILGDMTRQAYYIGDFNEAVALARAGQQAAIRAGSR